MKDFGLGAIERISENGRRYYVTPEGNKYPSVTTVLSHDKKQAIEEWKQRIGVDKANFLTKRAADRGTVIHGLLEHYLKGGEVTNMDASPFYINMFKPIREHLDKEMTELWAVEMPLYSDKFKAAGTADCIGLFGTEPELVDFKTSVTEKREEWIHNYLMQASCYAFMFHERTGITINKYRILIADEYGSLQVFTGNTNDYIKDFAKARLKYKRDLGI